MKNTFFNDFEVIYLFYIKNAIKNAKTKFGTIQNRLLLKPLGFN